MVLLTVGSMSWVIIFGTISEFIFQPTVTVPFGKISLNLKWHPQS